MSLQAIHEKDVHAHERTHRYIVFTVNHRSQSVA